MITSDALNHLTISTTNIMIMAMIIKARLISTVTCPALTGAYGYEAAKNN